ncbi:MAG TPA: hypothetical protein VGG62_10675 [Terracidiphilus sp.]|jgi:hypothetical protein
MSKFTEWPTKEPAAQRIGVSVKTLERMADAGKIEQKMRPRVGGTPQAIFNPEDVEREAAKRAQAYVMTEKSDSLAKTLSETVEHFTKANGTAPPGTASLPAVRSGEMVTWSHPAAELAQQLAAAAAVRVPIADKPRVTMLEAISLGFTRENLRELVRTGELANMGTPHRFRFRRRDLDAL